MENKLKLIVNAIHKAKGENIIIYDFKEMNPFIDRVVITSASNLRQVQAITKYVSEELRKNKFMERVEGNSESRWVLIDADDIIVHIFLDEERDVYRLERLYDGLPMVEIENV